VDRVAIPTDLPAGDWVLGWRWDCEQSPQVWASCSDVTITNPIVGGQGDFKYQYMPDLLKPPAGASLTNCHGLVTDADKNIYLTYQNDGKTDKNCLIKWKPDGTGAEFVTGGNMSLCDGAPHGLTIVNEPTATNSSDVFLYHANNNQKLTKTALDGTIVWQKNGNFGQDPKGPYRPTW
jgi:hypothetical protein